MSEGEDKTTSEPVSVEALQAEKKALLEGNSQLGRKVKALEESIAAMRDNDAHTQAALEQMNNLLSSYAQRGIGEDESDEEDPDGGFVTKKNIGNILSEYKDKEKTEEMKSQENYQKEYTSTLRKLMEKDKLKISTAVIDLMKEDAASGRVSYEYSKTNNAASDARINYAEAEKVVLARKLAGKDSMFRQEVGEGLGIGGPSTSTSDKVSKEISVSAAEIAHIKRLKPGISDSAAEEWGKKIKLKKQEVTV